VTPASSAETPSDGESSSNRAFGSKNEAADIPEDLILELGEKGSGPGDAVSDTAELLTVPDADALTSDELDFDVDKVPDSDVNPADSVANGASAVSSVTLTADDLPPIDTGRPSSVRGTKSTLELGATPEDFDVDEAARMNDALDSPTADADATIDEDLSEPLPSLDPEISSLAAQASARMAEKSAANPYTKNVADRPVMDEALDQTGLQDELGEFAEGAESLISSHDEAEGGGTTPKLSDDELAFLDQSIDAGRANVIEQQREVLHQKDALTEELERQADTWLPSDAGPAQAADDPLPLAEAQALNAEDVDPEESETNSDSGIAGVAAAGAAAAAGATALVTRDNDAHVAADYSHAGAGAIEDITSAPPSLEQAELLSGRGGLYRVFSRGPTDTRAVKRGLSWTAMFFTLPWLFAKRMPGTAIVYALLAVLLVAGLLITGISWLDAPESADQTIAWWPIAFAVLSFIGLLLVPLFMANRWHAASLMGRGYEEIATVRAPTPSRAIDRILQLAA